MSTFIPSGKWKRKGANLPKNVQIAKAKKGKIRVGRNPLTGTWTKRDDKSGKFMDIQTYKKAHGQDIKRKNGAEGFPNTPVIEMPNVTRFEVIDDTGRAYVKYGVAVSLSHQDEGRTLKVFVEPRRQGRK